MSVRRLAEPAVQPATFAFNEANAEAAKVWIAKYPEGREQSAIIPLLMIAQDQEGWVSKPAIESISDMLGMPYIRGLEVATFYTQYQLKPVGSKAHIQVCGTTPCMLRGSDALMDVCRSQIHHDQFHLNESGTLSWEEVECLGACVNAPMVMIFKDTFEDLTPERLAEIIDAFDKGDGASVIPGPQIGRVYSAPVTGPTSLTDETALLKDTRDREAKEAAANQNTEGGDVPPSNAAKPKTDAVETDPALKAPDEKKGPDEKPAAPKSDAAKAPEGGEPASPMPAFDKKAADLAEPAVEGDGKKRTRPIQDAGAAGFKAPEMLRGDSIGASGRNMSGEIAPPPAGPVAGTMAASPSKARQPTLNDPNRPASIDKPSAADDLKLISGIGPKIEGILHSLGIHTYAQVAAWTVEESGWVDGYPNFKGRIARDNWRKQAEALAKGGVAEYVRVFGRKPV